MNPRQYRVSLYVEDLQSPIVIAEFEGCFRPYQSINGLHNIPRYFKVLSLPFQHAILEASGLHNLFGPLWPLFQVERVNDNGEWQTMFWRFGEKLLGWDLNGEPIMVIPCGWSIVSYVRRCGVVLDGR